MAVAFAAFSVPWQAASQPKLSPGLFGTLPILWPESVGSADILGSQAPQHWVAAALGKAGRVRPVDTLDPVPAGLDLLVMAQPRPLSPQENVALDAWVRSGGKVLLFADPMLTWHSRHAIGDPRRPHDIVMVSPILAHWGLLLQFDESQPSGERTVHLLRRDVPVNLPGRFVRLASASDCTFLANGFAADCRIGRGRLLALADAALLEPAAAVQEPARTDVLDSLLNRLASAP